MMEAFDAFCKKLMNLGSFAGLLFLIGYMKEDLTDYLTWTLIVFMLVNATLAAINAYKKVRK